MSAKIGILAIQGDVAENVSSLVASIADLNQDATVHVVKTPLKEEIPIGSIEIFASKESFCRPKEFLSIFTSKTSKRG